MRVEIIARCCGGRGEGVATIENRETGLVAMAIEEEDGRGEVCAVGGWREAVAVEDQGVGRGEQVVENELQAGGGDGEEMRTLRGLGARLGSVVGMLRRRYNMTLERLEGWVGRGKEGDGEGHDNKGAVGLPKRRRPRSRATRKTAYASKSETSVGSRKPTESSPAAKDIWKLRRGAIATANTL